MQVRRKRGQAKTPHFYWMDKEREALRKAATEEPLRSWEEIAKLPIFEEKKRTTGALSQMWG